ncbi:MAG: GrdX family protein [Lachnospiraceae bacterium]
MGNSFRCITNNPLVKERGFWELEYYDTDVLGLFHLVKSEVEAGYKLLTHPLSGSIRPDITPYKTVLLSARAEKERDGESEGLIEKAIRYAGDLYGLREVPVYKRWNDAAKKDFQLVDLSIIERALEVAQMNR